MRRYLARRLLLLVPVLAGVSVIIFMVLHLSPGDPAEIMLGSQATKEDLARLRVDLGLNEPLHAQYLHVIVCGRVTDRHLDGRDRDRRSRSPGRRAASEPRLPARGERIVRVQDGRPLEPDA